MANNTKLIIMSVLMVVTGSLNTVFVKLADMQTSENSVGDTEGSGVFFNHPFLQAASMFLGEMLCIITFILLKFTGRLDEDTNEEGKKFHPIKHGYIFLLPALCDMCATSLMYVGLNFTPASHFQIFRGSLIIFTGLLRVVWLRKGLEWYKWLGMVVILAGLGVVAVGSFPPFAEEICNSYNVTDQSPMAPSFTTGTFGISISNTDTSLACSDSNTASAKAMDVFKGDMLIVAGQVVMAVQGVYEEKVLVQYNAHPLLAVAWEGTWGFTALSILLVPFGYWHVSEDWAHGPTGLFEDSIDAFVQLGNNAGLCVWFVLTMFSIAFFNFSGMYVTQKVGATARTVLDSVRTIVIWLVFLIPSEMEVPGWHDGFSGWSLAGYIVSIIGVFLFNNIVILPTIQKYRNKNRFA